jgi:hypothetical protein
VQKHCNHDANSKIQVAEGKFENLGQQRAEGVGKLMISVTFQQPKDVPAGE